MKYQVGGAVHASTWVGTFEANSPEEAIERAYEAAHVSVCHQCAEKISDPEVACLWAEDESGNVTSEPSDHDKLVDAHNQLATQQAALVRIREWADQYGADLKPPSADTYGEGKRDAKAQVKRMLAALEPK
jgi:hypothetical protein